FTATTFYDGQGFMVAKDLGVESPDQFDGASICIQSGTTHELNLADYFPSRGIEIQTVTFDTPDQTAQGFASGRCDILTSDTSQLSALRLQLPEPDSVEILETLISKEPLGPVVRQGDDQWLDIVQWSIFAMVNAEELGVTSGNVDEMREDAPNPQVARLLGVDGNYGEQLGIGNDWAYNIINHVGNYGEVFAATVGEDSPMQISRGMNALWNEGGILYAPPVR
ncbi:amino acid ABC transporter substrate-binding protein, partial [Halomonas sp.]|uniref:amino acid ABC transporter substrate-binding protein n=1 Tax=Halomonas sp. TaxID=1486246 RepID=UPI003D12DD36